MHIYNITTVYGCHYPSWWVCGSIMHYNLESAQYL